MRFATVGTGRMGTALTLALMQSGHEAVACYRVPPHGAGGSFTGLTGNAIYPLTPPNLQPVAGLDLIVICVPDGAVTHVAQTLSEHAPVEGNTIVAHTAGALGSDVLSPILAHTNRIVSWHPLQSVANPELGARLFKGVYFSLEGHPDALESTAEWTRDIGGVPFLIEAANRPRYHAAAALASNSLVALAAVAVQVMGEEHALHALLPLMKGTLRNLEQIGLPGALTGPIDRDDEATILRHLDVLKDNPTAKQVYQVLGAATAQVAADKGSLTDQQLARILCILQGE